MKKKTYTCKICGKKSKGVPSHASHVHWCKKRSEGSDKIQNDAKQLEEMGKEKPKRKYTKRKEVMPETQSQVIRIPCTLRIEVQTKLVEIIPN